MGRRYSSYIFRICYIARTISFITFETEDRRMASKERQMKGAHASNSSSNIECLKLERKSEWEENNNNKKNKRISKTQAENNMDKWDTQPSQKFKGKLF